MNVGERLRTLRLKAKKTLKEQSENFDVSVNSIYRWEHGLAVPRGAVLRRMAEFYDVPLEWLLHGSAVKSQSQDNSAALHADYNIEQQLLRMFSMLSENSKYKILGYVERVYIESMDEILYSTVPQAEN